MIKKLLIEMALGYLAAFLQMIGLPQLNEFGKILGMAFGPSGCRHFCELSASEREQLFIRAPILRTDHTDWPKPLRWIPRSLTAYIMVNNEPPSIIYGTGSVEDIPEPGTYVVTEGYMAWTSTTKLHMRVGFRWDQAGKFLEFPAATIKQLG